MVTPFAAPQGARDKSLCRNFNFWALMVLIRFVTEGTIGLSFARRVCVCTTARTKLPILAKYDLAPANPAVATCDLKIGLRHVSYNRRYATRAEADLVVPGSLCVRPVRHQLFMRLWSWNTLTKFEKPRADSALSEAFKCDPGSDRFRPCNSHRLANRGGGCLRQPCPSVPAIGG